MRLMTIFLGTHILHLRHRIIISPWTPCLKEEFQKTNWLDSLLQLTLLQHTLRSLRAAGMSSGCLTASQKVPGSIPKCLLDRKARLSMVPRSPTCSFIIYSYTVAIDIEIVSCKGSLASKSLRTPDLQHIYRYRYVFKRCGSHLYCAFIQSA